MNIVNTSSEPIDVIDFSRSPKIEVEINFLLRLHNLAPQDSVIRTEIRNVIETASQKDKKSHWARGLLETESGDLAFSTAVYELAVWRGKQDTYAKSAQTAFDDLKNAISFVCHFQDREDEAAHELDGAELGGTPIIPILPASDTAAILKAHSKALALLVEKMEGGLADGLVSPLSMSTNDQRKKI